MGGKEIEWQDRIGRDGREKEGKADSVKGERGTAWERERERVNIGRDTDMQGERDMRLILKDGGRERRNQDLGKTDMGMAREANMFIKYRWMGE